MNVFHSKDSSRFQILPIGTRPRLTRRASGLLEPSDAPESSKTLCLMVARPLGPSDHRRSPTRTPSTQISVYYVSLVRSCRVIAIRFNSFFPTRIESS